MSMTAWLVVLVLRAITPSCRKVSLKQPLVAEIWGPLYERGTRPLPSREVLVLTANSSFVAVHPSHFPTLFGCIAMQSVRPATPG